MCGINCSGGCPACSPGDHLWVIVDDGDIFEGSLFNLWQKFPETRGKFETEITRWAQHNGFKLYMEIM